MGAVLFAMGISVAIWLALFQLVTHFAIDVIKGRMNVWYPSLQNPANYFHWWVFGADQMLHVAVILFMHYLAL